MTYTNPTLSGGLSAEKTGEKQQAAASAATRFLYMVVLYMAPKYGNQAVPEQRGLGRILAVDSQAHPAALAGDAAVNQVSGQLYNLTPALSRSVSRICRPTGAIANMRRSAGSRPSTVPTNETSKRASNVSSTIFISCSAR